MCIYDDTNPIDIERYAKKLIGKTFLDILSKNASPTMFNSLINRYNNPKGKGTLGTLIEEFYFFYQPNSISDADFPKAGVELKVTPYERNKQGLIKAGERIVITMIPNNQPVVENFYQSHLFIKIRLLLLIFYFRNREIPRVQYSIDFVKLFSILNPHCREDLAIIIDDYHTIINKIKAGLAHELSEADTQYLGACSKGATAIKSLQPQYYSNIPAKRRAFSLKQSYVNYILNHYIANEIVTYDAALSNHEIIFYGFEQAILNKINIYIGRSEEELYSLFSIGITNKGRNNALILSMLGVKTDNALEFEKGNIEIKTIRANANGRIKESMSFPKFVIHDFIRERFESSFIYNLFSQKRFLFVVFKEDSFGTLRLTGAKFWNMPIQDLEGIGYQEWLLYQTKFKEGVHFTITPTRILNDLPKMSDTTIFHVRPHSRQSAYIINGIHYGNGTLSDMDSLPNGDKMTWQCFWLNHSYIEYQIKNLLF